METSFSFWFGLLRCLCSLPCSLRQYLPPENERPTQLAPCNSARPACAHHQECFRHPVPSSRQHTTISPLTGFPRLLSFSTVGCAWLQPLLQLSSPSSNHRPHCERCVHIFCKHAHKPAASDKRARVSHLNFTTRRSELPPCVGPRLAAGVLRADPHRSMAQDTVLPVACARVFHAGLGTRPQLHLDYRTGSFAPDNPTNRFPTSIYTGARLHPPVPPASSAALAPPLAWGASVTHQHLSGST